MPKKNPLQSAGTVRGRAPRRAPRPQPSAPRRARATSRTPDGLEQVAEEWRFTIDAIPDVILVCNPHGLLHRLNRSALLLLGGAFQDWVGQPVARIEPRAPFGVILDCARRLLADPAGQTDRVCDPASEQVWDVSCTRWDSRPYTVVVARNATETARLQESLARAENMANMGQLLGAVAHEVRNPLFGISALLDAWRVNLTTADPEEYFALLTKEVERLRVLMADLLEYGRPFSLNRRVVSLQAAVLDAIGACERQAAAAGVTLSSTLSESLVRMDPSRLPRVFTNLLENAIQHSPSGADVAIAIRPHDAQHVNVHVSDSGPGFSDEAIQHMFTPFYSRRRGGTGLGLAIAKRIVDEHRGTLTAQNNPARGATLTVTLPVAD